MCKISIHLKNRAKNLRVEKGKNPPSHFHFLIKAAQYGLCAGQSASSLALGRAVRDGLATGTTLQVVGCLDTRRAGRYVSPVQLIFSVEGADKSGQTWTRLFLR